MRGDRWMAAAFAAGLVLAAGQAMAKRGDPYTPASLPPAGFKGAQFVDSLAPQDGDIVLEGKRGLDAFASTNLDFILRSKGVRTVALAGFLTNCCVESTMRSAYERGFEVITLTDCVGATSMAEHDNAIAYDYPMFSKPMTADEFVAALAGVESGDTSRGY